MTVYLDHNATTPTRDEVVDAMLPYLREHFGNPSSPHQVGRRARDAVERARVQLASLIHCEPDEIVFCGSGTEANNLALRGAQQAHGHGHLLVSPVEHHAVGDCAADLGQGACDVELLDVGRDGRVDPASIERALTDSTFAVSVMHANNETGVVQPVEEIGALLPDDVLFHVDAVQSVGKLPVDVRAMGVDLLALSGHKFHGPKGVGALYVRRGTPIAGIMQGGAQENGLRPGTYDTAGIVGLGKAAEMARLGMDVDPGYVASLRDRLQREIHARWPGAVVIGADAPRLPGTALVCFPGAHGATLVQNLDIEGIAVSTGAACSSGSTGPSHVLKAMGIDEELARGAVRFSLGCTNSQEDVDETVRTLRALLTGRNGLGRSLLGAARAAVRR